jgi:3-hydroxybutyrate dehydrogenase
MQLKDKVALVTGAGSGIGKAISEVFAQEGAVVLINDVDERGQETADAINGVFLKADLSRVDEVRRLGRAALDVRGQVDILVNNAGFQHVSPVEEFPDDIWTKIIQVMVTAPFQLIKALVPEMKKNKWGRIINISSIHGLVASPFKVGYVTAKHAMIGLTRTVALEVGSDGITINAICPAYVRTPLVERQIKEQAKSHGISEDEVIHRIMLEPAAIKRLIEPKEIGEFALYLASDRGKSINGSAQTIDLGWTAR